MEAITFTIAAIALYLGSDWALQRIELAVGHRLEHRSLIFFAILLGAALLTFAALRRLGGG